MWYAQERFKPAGMIDLATLTGAIIIGLGHENAGVFSNNDALRRLPARPPKAEGEGAWRMPLGQAYDDMLKSRIADMKNVGGRAAGSITAAQFLQRFVKDDTPWIHLDIAGRGQREIRHRAGAQGRDRLGRAGARPAGARRLRRLRRRLGRGLFLSPDPARRWR
jgi:leucyl aminopeptidase